MIGSRLDPLVRPGEVRCLVLDRVLTVQCTLETMIRDWPPWLVRWYVLAGGNSPVWAYYPRDFQSIPLCLRLRYTIIIPLADKYIIARDEGPLNSQSGI